jgi:hypothetical protein
MPCPDQIQISAPSLSSLPHSPCLPLPADPPSKHISCAFSRASLRAARQNILPPSGSSVRKADWYARAAPHPAPTAPHPHRPLKSSHTRPGLSQDSPLPLSQGGSTGLQAAWRRNMRPGIFLCSCGTIMNASSTPFIDEGGPVPKESAKRVGPGVCLAWQLLSRGSHAIQGRCILMSQGFLSVPFHY